MRARVRGSKGVARVYFFTEAPAEFQHHSHLNCMMYEFGKSRELHALLGLKPLLRQLPQLPQW